MCEFLLRYFLYAESEHKKVTQKCVRILRKTKKHTKTSQNGAFFAPKITSDSLIYRLMNLT
jgi:hypothetical protein